jgi:hypothetical protein
MDGRSVVCNARCDYSLVCVGDGGVSKAVDIYNVITGIWSTAVLSEARALLAATSLPNQGLAIFAGGSGTLFDCYCDDCREAYGLRGMCGGGWGDGCMRGRSVVCTSAL